MKDLYQRTFICRQNRDAGVQRFMNLFERAHVFTIDNDLLRAIVELSKATSGARMVPFAKLPYPAVFLQWRAEAEFPPGSEARPDAAYFPSQMGVLLEPAGADRATTPEGDAVDGILAHPVLENPAGASPAPLSALFNRHTLEMASAAGSSAYYYDWSPFMGPLIRRQFPDVTIEQLKADVQAELALIPWILAAINSPNLTARQRVPRSTPAGPGKPHGSIVHHHKVTLKLSRVQSQRSGVGPQSSAAQRLHSVRGHFKLRTNRGGESKLFWWNSFLRGATEQGVVTKEYTVVK